MSRSFARENARLRREIALLRQSGQSRAAALYDATHVQGETVASATTIVLQSPFCYVSGTATITGIGELPAGTTRRVIFSGAAGLTHSSALILPGGGNITCAANDAAEFVSLGGGDWFCAWYRLANGTLLGVVPITKGGTGQTTAVAGKDALTVQSSNIASASTTDLSTATGEAVTITGTTTITSFGTAAAGVKRVLTFNGILTITHNATSLILPDGQNIVTAAKDVGVFISLGSGNWRLSSYQPYSGRSVIPAQYQNVGCRLTFQATVPFPVTSSTGSSAVKVFVLPFLGGGIPIPGDYPSEYGIDDDNYSILLTDVTQSGTTTNGSPTVTGLTDTRQLIKGMRISGTNIPTNTTITAIPSNTSVTMSANATGSGSTALTITIPANKNVDIFLSDRGLTDGEEADFTVAVRFGNLWTSDTVRADAIERPSGAGFYVNQSGIDVGRSSGTGMRRGIYVGTVRTTGTHGESEMSATKMYLWNYFNRSAHKFKVVDTTDTWNYTTQTWRQANNATGNKVEFIVGVNEDLVSFRVLSVASNSTTSVYLAVGVGIDSTSANSSDLFGNRLSGGGGLNRVEADYAGFPGIGYHYAAWLEISQTGGTTVWYGDNGLTFFQMGMVGRMMA